MRALGDCPVCGHRWMEHGFGNDLDGTCGECVYEFEHDQRETPEPGCTLSAPPVNWGCHHKRTGHESAAISGLAAVIRERPPGAGDRPFLVIEGDERAG
jgi:hypothetical protein